MKTPQKHTVKQVFEGRDRYSAPIFQRYYVWKKEELQALLDDVENATDETSTQFIGATVIQDMGKKGGSKSPCEYLMIDGQQRLTTVYLLLCGIVWCYLRKNKTADAKRIGRKYLHLTGEGYTGVPKLRPTVQDRKQLYNILRAEVDCVNWDFSDSPEDSTSRKRGIVTQWVNIKKHMLESYFGYNERLLKAKLVKFEHKLLKQIELVQIVLEPQDDANTVFSKLNHLGVTLSIADLVRNDIFTRFSTNEKEEAQKFYETKWLPFEKSFPNNSFDTYVPIFATIKFKGGCTKARAFPKLQKSWKNKKPQAILNELKAYSVFFSALTEYEPIPTFDKRANGQVQRLSHMPKTTVTWPYILQVLKAFNDKKVSKNQMIKSLQIVESFLVRRAVCGLEPTGLHAVFKGLWNKAGVDKKLLKAKIITTTIKCPGDPEVRGSLRADNMYSRQITKHLLIQREVSFNKKHGYDNAVEKFSAEHVMPKNYKKHWKSVVTTEEHTTYLNVMGNLLPLTPKQNSGIRDWSWADKRKKIKGSNWKIAQKAARLKTWDVAQIKRRSNEFTKWAIEEWPDISKM